MQLAGIAVLFAATTGTFFVTRDGGLFPFDDSYITQAAARNVIEHGVLAVDPAKPWRGVTSPLHVGLVASAGRFIGIPTAARAVGIASHALLVVLAAFLAFAWAGESASMTDRRRAAWWAAILAAASGYLTLHSLSGMETTLFVALVLAAIAAHAFVVRENSTAWNRVLRGMLVAGAIATRPEGFALAAALWGDDLWRAFGARAPRCAGSLVAEALLVAALIAPFAFAYQAHTGTWWSDTGAIKAAFFRLDTDDRALRSMGAYLGGITRFAARHAPFVAFAVFAWRRGGVSRVAMRAPLAFAALFYTGAAVFPAGLQMYWLRYQMPVLALLLPVAAIGVAAWSAKTDPRQRRRILAALVIFLVLDALAARRNYVGDLRQTRVSVVATADWLREHTAPGDLVAAHDLGASVDLAHRPVLDMVGLIDPESAAANRADVSKKALWQVIESRRPAWLVMFDAANTAFFRFEGEIERGRLEKFWQSEAGRVPEKRYTIYRCRWDAPKSP
ncbi:MAG: hypothetical protein IT350_05465 [Deltaproteobacteria bacterium]|nr:hypothetical protein [Deltaproteobacteria bacterium]